MQNPREMMSQIKLAYPKSEINHLGGGTNRGGVVGWLDGVKKFGTYFILYFLDFGLTIG